MLVLSRKRNQSLVITTKAGEVIEVVVVDIRGDKVRLGTKAARETVIDRNEIHELKASDRDRHSR